jgi:uncharacterized Zn-finger protein
MGEAKRKAQRQAGRAAEIEREHEQFRCEMTEMANQHHEAMQGMTEREAADYVKGVIGSATIVYGVYQDAEAPNGVGLHIIKGKREMQVGVASRETIQVRVAAIPCIELEQAIAAEQVYGDGQLRNDS